MDRDTQKNNVANTHTERTGLLFRKGEDYAGVDTLANFKRMSALCTLLNIDPRRSSVDCALFLMMLKVDRWCNLLAKNAEPRNESIKDTVLDLLNYVELAYLCSLDQSGLDKTPEHMV